MTTLLLALLAVALAGPVPWLLARMPALRFTPRAAMVLWQSVALAAVLAALGAGLALATTGLLAGHGDGKAAGSSDEWAGWYVVAGLALLLTLVVLGRLLLSAHLVGRRLRALRRRHRDLVDLLDEQPSDGWAGERRSLRVVPGEVPMVYCLPGVGRARVVFSDAAYRGLGERERGAVLAHERAHLRARHDLVLEAFTTLRRAFPAVVSSHGALAEVGLLVEVLADRAARASYDTACVLRALEGMLDAPVPHATLGAGGELSVRIEVLLDERDRRAQAVLLYAASAAVLLLPTVLVVLPWLSSLCR